jgi:hypothetical protein
MCMLYAQSAPFNQLKPFVIYIPVASTKGTTFIGRIVDIARSRRGSGFLKEWVSVVAMHCILTLRDFTYWSLLMISSYTQRKRKVIRRLCGRWTRQVKLESHPKDC